MNSKIRIRKSIYCGKITVSTLADLAFILYFINPFLRTGFGWVTSFVGLESMAWTFTLILVYLPLFLLLLYKPRNTIPLDCIVLFAFVLAFFGVSFLLHPEYGTWYARADYGAWSYVFRPNQAIYAYLFVRLMDSQERMFRNLKISGWIMYVYFLYQVYVASTRGYWIGVSGGSNVHMSYSVSFGYDVMLYALPFIYCAWKDHKLTDIIGAGLGLFLILSYGSRGPLLFLGIFILLLCVKMLQRSRKKVLIIALIAIGIIVVYAFYIPILVFLMERMESVGISSRFLSMLLEGTIASDSGRTKIWMAALEMIKDNPFGYGFMGSQHVISKLILAGYPHSFILEILIDFGVIVGGIFLLLIFYYSCAMLFSPKNSAWSGVFLAFFGTACQLFISLCFWSATAFWVCLAITVNCYYDRRRMRRITSQKPRFETTEGV